MATVDIDAFDAWLTRQSLTAKCIPCIVVGGLLRRYRDVTDAGGLTKALEIVGIEIDLAARI